MRNVIHATELLKTINDYIYANGGAKVLADLIISENHTLYENEAVEADIRLRSKGILTYEDIKPKSILNAHMYSYEAIKWMYPNYSYLEMAEQLNRSVNYVCHAIHKMIKRGEIQRIRPIYKPWTDTERDFLIKNAKSMTSKAIGEILGRTEYAVGNRKRILGLTMDEKHKKLAGRRAHKHFINRT